jgi:murein DD-endopeptidase MepM/ murein hydrolase activator NlpD
VARRLTLLLLTATALALPATAPAATGGAAPPAGAGETLEQTPKSTKKKSRKTSSLTFASFGLNGARFYEYGRSIRAGFELSGRGSARVKIVFVRSGRRVKVVDLGDRTAGSQHNVIVPVAGLPTGALDVRLSARDSRGRVVRSGPQAASSRAIDVRSHRFPVVGPHTFGGEGSRFGADRDGGKRRHQGQDISAGHGTPMAAARGGVVRYTGNQPSAAGVYVVIRGAGESRDYVYMHLVEGSLAVRTGDSVRTGSVIGQVGQTGSASGPHLHFEIWQGSWQGGGAAIDPLPLLQRWDAWS